MKTRSVVKNKNKSDDNVVRDTESIFDPPHNVKPKQLDSKNASKCLEIPISTNPIFAPLGFDDSETRTEVDALVFNSSLSQDMEDDSSFSDYLAMGQYSLKGFPVASPSEPEHQLSIPFPSPLNDKDAHIMNEALSIPFDFNENPAATGMTSPNLNFLPRNNNSPQLSPQRRDSETDFSTHNGPLKSTDSSSTSSYFSHSFHQNDAIPMKNGSDDFCVTPSPSHASISKAVSDESKTPPPMVHLPPSTTHPMCYHRAGLPLSMSYNSPNWSNSLHLAPLSPFLASNGTPPTPQWKHPGEDPTKANARGPYAHTRYLSYCNPLQQLNPIRVPKESGVEAVHWRHKHHLLYRFRAKFGHCGVPPAYGVGTEYEGLFEWVRDQHHQHQHMMNGKPSTMTPTRARLLSDIGFVFLQVPNEAQVAASSWSNWMHQLKEYRRKHDNVDVPLKYGPNPSLGTFVNRQRTEYRKLLAKKPSTMTMEKVEELNKLGFTWTIKESHTAWEDRFEELKAYKEENGHANVPKIYPNNPSLGYWVNEQRFQYKRLQKNRPSYMTEDKIKALNSLDFKWTLRETNGSWDNWLKELELYKNKHGNVDVPLKYKANLALGAFVNRQRTEYRKLKQGRRSSLSNKRIEDLNSMGFKWAIRVSRTPWEKRLNELKKFKAENGHTNVPSSYPQNQPLAYWVFKQRGQYRIYMKSVMGGLKKEDRPICHMTPERIMLLNQIGFDWNTQRRVE